MSKKKIPILSTKMAGHLILSGCLVDKIRPDKKDPHHQVFWFEDNNYTSDKMKDYSNAKDSLYNIYGKSSKNEPKE